MDELTPGPASPAAPVRVGESLRVARERLGLSLAEVASRTRVPLRHLEAIELNDYGGLPSHTYATGFAKAYARAIGVDEVDIARRVRGEVAGSTRRVPEYRPEEVADPARVPSRGLTWAALLLAVAVLVAAGLYFGTGLFRQSPPGEPGLTALDGAPAEPVAPSPAPSPAAATGQVLVTATDEVWVRIYDAGGRTIHQGTLQPGEHFEVPADADQPMINVGRPDKIAFTLNGSPITGLDLGRDPIKDVRVSAAALTARASGQPAPAASPTASSTPARPTPATTRTERRREAPARRADRPRVTRERLTETQRANLDAAAPPAAPGNTQ